MIASRLFLPAAVLATALSSHADEIGQPATGSEAEKLRQDASTAVKSFAVAPGLKVEVWASEPLLANPVALAFDSSGKAYVAETYRRRSSVPDIRRYEDWTIANLALRSVEDRVAFLKSRLPENPKTAPTRDKPDRNGDGQFDWRDLEVESERVKVIEDSDGDGRGDRARVLAEGFNSLATGVGAGVCAHEGDVYYTCAPDLWKISSDGKKEKLLTGFGVHVAYGGHDLHGPKIGPDGRLYWTIADCGARVTCTDGKSIDVTDSGAVFRSELDGSDVTLVAQGLRNPQSLAFNDLGDLFTGDNNADGGDKARWIHVIEGADYGWRIGWQFLTKLGAWNSEGMWHLNAGEQHLAILPAAGHVGHGPAGIAYYPGTGLPDSYRDHFFYADFPGGIRSFQLTPKGASYTIDNPGEILLDNSPQKLTGKVLWGLYPSDVAFAPGAGIYALDWVQGWEKTGKGRIFRVFDPRLEKDALILETKRLLKEGFTQRSTEELAGLLGHADQRVRLGAQFQLARAQNVEALLKAAKNGTSTIARIHALWGIGQTVRELSFAARVQARAKAIRSNQEIAAMEEMARKDPAAFRAWLAKQPVCDLPAFFFGERIVPPLKQLEPFLSDADAEVVAQTARVIAEILETSTDNGEKVAERSLIASLLKAVSSNQTRVRFFAARALAYVDGDEAGRALVDLGLGEGKSDPFIRHVAAWSLAKLGERALSNPQLSHNDLRALRLALLAEVISYRMKPLGSVREMVGMDRRMVNRDAARATHDEPRSREWNRLAEALDWEANSEQETAEIDVPFTLRAINANYLLGTAEAAKRLGRFASNAKAPDSLRLFAINSLAIWSQPFGRDRITGLWRDIPARSKAQGATEVAAKILNPLLNDPREPVQLAAAEMAESLRLTPGEAALMEVVNEPTKGGKVRAAALRALVAMNSPKAEEAVKVALADSDKTLAESGRKLAAKASPAAAVKVNANVLGKGSVSEQQAALATIAQQNVPEADRVLTGQLALLTDGKLPRALWLDLEEAASTRKDPRLKATLAAYTAKRDADAFAKWRACLEGGDARIGREIFYEKAEAACLRCHKVKGEGGDVGPDLAGLASKHDREYLLRAIIDPNAEIAPGFQNVMVTLTDGSIVAGLLSAEDAKQVTLKSLADGTPQLVEKARIKDRTIVPSAMPPGLGEVLGKRAVRDVVEYLGTLK